MSRLVPAQAFEHAQPFPLEETPRPHLTIGLVNNMPDAALAATERQFGDLLRDARPDFDIQLRLFSFRATERGERAAAFMAGRYLDAGRLPAASLDGLVVTGAEPRTADIADEPYWDEFTRLADWTERSGAPVIWSCLAAHAAVLHQAGVRRHPLTAKLSGVFASHPVSDDPLLVGAPARLSTPHSRQNALVEDGLTGAGYRILTRSSGAGVDSFVRRGSSLGLFFQGHPEYDGDTLMREYLRDAGRFLRGERPTHPATPSSYFERPTERALEVLAERARRRPHAHLHGAYVEATRNAAPRPVWRALALSMVGAWLDEVSRGVSRAQVLARA